MRNAVRAYRNTTKGLHRHTAVQAFRIYTLAAMLAVQSAAAAAQQLAADWLTAPPQADSSACLWLRRSFVMPGRPKRATIHMATDSRAVLYVNGRNVSAALFMPCRESGDSRTVAVDIDITRFMRPDTNTVALLVCPAERSHAHAEGATSFAAPRALVDFYGTTAGGRRFAYGGADGWMCRQAGTRLTDTGELMDGGCTGVPPQGADMEMPQWLPAAAAEPPEGAAAYVWLAAESIYGYSHRVNIIADRFAYVQRILQPRYFDISGNTVTYDFAPGFHGTVRVTLRGCRPGERIRIGNLMYTCSGDTDEQAFCRFTPQYARKLTVSGDRHFTPEQVQEVEAVCF